MPGAHGPHGGPQTSAVSTPDRQDTPGILDPDADAMLWHQFVHRTDRSVTTRRAHQDILMQPDDASLPDWLWQAADALDGPAIPWHDPDAVTRALGRIGDGARKAAIDQAAASLAVVADQWDRDFPDEASVRHHGGAMLALHAVAVRDLPPNDAASCAWLALRALRERYEAALAGNHDRALLERAISLASGAVEARPVNRATWLALDEGLLAASALHDITGNVRSLLVLRDLSRNLGTDRSRVRGPRAAVVQLAAEALDPTIQVLAPWRIAAFRERFPGRKELIEFCEEKNIPVKASKGKPYSSDENCLHTSYEAGLLEELTTDGFALVDFGMTVSPQAAPDTPETVRLDFESGVPVRVNGRSLKSHEMVLALNDIGGRHGIGRTDIVENRLVEQMTLDRDLVHLRDRLSPEVAEMVYYGFWYVAKMDALMAFIRETQKPVTGTVELNLYKGNILVKSRESSQSLYDAAIASMEGGGSSYDQTDAEGFLRILGLPSRVQGHVRPRG